MILNKATSFIEIADVAEDVLKSMPDNLDQVCGPITTGGFSKIENMNIFNRCVIELRKRGFSPFDQTPLEKAIDRLVNDYKKNNQDYCMPILDVVYKRIFQSGKIKSTYFIPGWKSSFGARWERNIVQELGIEINEFPILWYQDILKELNLLEVVV